MKDQTSIVIAHWLTTIERADRLIVIKNGEVVEEGTFEKLKNGKGHFAEMCQALA